MISKAQKTLTEPNLVVKSKKPVDKVAKGKSSTKIETKVEFAEVTKAEIVEPVSSESEVEVETTIKPTTSQNDFIQSLSSDELKLFNEIYTACFTNNPTKLRQLVSCPNAKNFESENKSILVEKLLNKRLNKVKGFTLLHLSSEMGFDEIVWELLMNGADPALPDLTKQNRLPFNISSNKPTKDQFRRFMHDFPQRYDYTAARVDSGLSAEQKNEKAEREREKRKKQRKIKKEREAQSKVHQKKEDLEMEERKRFLSLTDQEKRMLIIDRNFLNIMPIGDNSSPGESVKSKFSPQDLKVISRCWFCAVDMSSNVPFEYFDYKFCSTKCLKSHRDQKRVDDESRIKATK